MCIHGHFYQPPRENPWLEAIELQDSAFPYHDWDERITAECYATNASSRILDDQALIVQIVQKIDLGLGLIKSLPFEVNLRKVQNRYYEILQRVYHNLRERADKGDEEAGQWVSLFKSLGEKLSVRVE
jgi:hypothetical protein